MGRVYVKPFMNNGYKPPPKLRWYRLYHDYKLAGDILASFELIHLNVIKIKDNVKNLF